MSNFQKDVQLLADLQGLIEKREKQVNPPEGSTCLLYTSPSPRDA